MSYNAPYKGTQNEVPSTGRSGPYKQSPPPKPPIKPQPGPTGSGPYGSGPYRK